MADESGEAKARPPPAWRSIVTRIGIPEVDRIVEGDRFRGRKIDRNPCTAAPPEDNNSNKEDLISQLPNDILQFIISMLTMKQRAATSIFSRQWRDLWSASTSRLDLSEFNMIGRSFFKVRRYLEDKATKQKFIQRVDRLLELCRGSRVDALRVSLSFDEAPTSDVDRWLEFAAAKGVSQLRLDFNISKVTYEFPIQIFAQQLRYLSLQLCHFNLPPNFSGLNSLISLTLREMELTEHDVQNILSNCSSLEMLDLLSCDFSDDSCLQFCGPSLLLKHISCRGCQGLKEITIRDINILSFELKFECYYGAKLSIKNAPCLTKLVVSNYCRTNVTCDNIPRLEILFMSSCHEESILPKLCDLNNLKQLVVLVTDVLKINLLEMVYLLEATPLLQKLKLDMGTSVETEENLESLKTRPRVATNNLKEVELYGFEGLPTKIEFAKYLLKNAIALEKMNISTERKTYIGNGSWRLRDRQTYKQDGIPLEEVTELLWREKNSSTELIIGSNSQ